MSVHRTLSKQSTNNVVGAGVFVALAGLFTTAKVMKSNLPSIEERKLTLSVGSNSNANVILPLLIPIAEKSLQMLSTTIGGVEYNHIASSTPAVINDIIDDALKGLCIVDYYAGGNVSFSLVFTDGVNSLESFWTGDGGGWKFYYAKTPVAEEEAFAIYRNCVRLHLENIDVK